MILITTALRAEAKALIEGLQLKGVNKPFSVYENENYVLVITGVGCIKCAAACGWALGHYADIAGAVNIGISGGQKNDCNELFVVNSVEYQDKGYMQAPDILYPCKLKERKCITTDLAVKNCDICIDDTVYDMEAYGFMSSVGNFLTNDKIALLKVVSDNIAEDDIPSPNDVTEIVKGKFNEINDFLNIFSQYCENTDKKPSFDFYTDVISKKYRLTQTQTSQLKNELHNSYIYHNALPDIDNLPLSAKNTRKDNTLAFEALLNNMHENIGLLPAEVNEPKKIRRKFFDRIYIEESIFSSERTKQISDKFPNAKIVKIPHYKNIFNRNKQNFSAQQNGKNLILAKATGNLVYKGSDYCNAFGFDKFYYCSTVMGCVYNCEYCYLQGIYPSANIVAFVNTEDFFEEIEKKTNGESALVCCSYDSDILALDSVLGTVKKWIEFAQKHSEITLEIRTKSANILPLEQKPLQNVIIAYTVSPESVSREYEGASPSLKARLTAADMLAKNGWRVRLCMEPVLVPIVPKSEYIALADIILRYCNSVKYEDIVVGEFRMNKSCYNKIAAQKYYSKLFHNPYAECSDDYMSYNGSQAAVNEIADYLRNNTDVNIITFEH